MANDDAITRAGARVFADPGRADVGERQTKLLLACAVNGLIAHCWLNWMDEVERANYNQPKLLKLASCALDSFSIERLMTLLIALDQGVDIVTRNKPRTRVTAQIALVAAAGGCWA